MPRILVLEDEVLISMLMEDWLKDLGCDVVGPVSSLQDGLDLAGNAELDGAILDVNLGGASSFQVADALRQRGIPFAFATGHNRLDPEAGFADPILLKKPFDFDAMKDVVGKLLDRSQA